jgi:hypothetical protein
MSSSGKHTRSDQVEQSESRKRQRLAEPIVVDEPMAEADDDDDDEDGGVSLIAHQLDDADELSVVSDSDDLEYDSDEDDEDQDDENNSDVDLLSQADDDEEFYVDDLEDDPQTSASMPGVVDAFKEDVVPHLTPARMSFVMTTSTAALTHS